MDRRERYNDPEEALRTALEGFQAKLWTAMPGIVQSFDPVKMTCVVQPAVKAVLTGENQEVSTVSLPLLLDCPVIFPCGGGFTLTFPIESGDECLVVFSSRCIDAWWQSGGIQEQAELRMHDLSDGFVFVGARSQVRVLTGVSIAAAQLRSDNGETFVEVGDTEVTITAPASVEVNAPDVSVNCETAEVVAETSVDVTSPITTVNGNVVINGTLNVSGLITGTGGMAISGGSGAQVAGNVAVTGGNVTADGVGLKTHVHTGVQTGGGNTGGPVG